MGFIAHDEIEGGLASDGVRVVVVGEFGQRDLFGPRRQVCSTEDVEVGFDFLVNLFGFSVSLRVVSGGEGEVIIKESS